MNKHHKHDKRKKHHHSHHNAHHRSHHRKTEHQNNERNTHNQLEEQDFNSRNDSLYTQDQQDEHALLDQYDEQDLQNLNDALYTQDQLDEQDSHDQNYEQDTQDQYNQYGQYEQSKKQQKLKANGRTHVQRVEKDKDYASDDEENIQKIKKKHKSTHKIKVNTLLSAETSSTPNIFEAIGKQFLLGLAKKLEAKMHNKNKSPHISCSDDESNQESKHPVSDKFVHKIRETSSNSYEDIDILKTNLYEALRLDS